MYTTSFPVPRTWKHSQASSLKTLELLLVEALKVATLGCCPLAALARSSTARNRWRASDRPSSNMFSFSRSAGRPASETSGFEIRRYRLSFWCEPSVYKNRDSNEAKKKKKKKSGGKRWQACCEKRVCWERHLSWRYYHSPHADRS